MCFAFIPSITGPFEESLKNEKGVKLGWNLTRKQNKIKI